MSTPKNKATRYADKIMDTTYELDHDLIQCAWLEGYQVGKKDESDISDTVIDSLKKRIAELEDSLLMLYEDVTTSKKSSTSKTHKRGKK